MSFRQHDDKGSKEANKEAVQTAVMTRLSEEVAQASMQTKEKHDRLESARRACQETAAAIQANVEACANSVDVAVPMHSTAVEHFAATEIAAVQLIKHVTAMPKVKRDTQVISVPQLEAEQASDQHESGAGSVVPLHAGCDPRCQSSRNGGTESERADRDGHSTTRTEGRIGCRRTKTPQHLLDAEKKDHNYLVATLTVVQQEHDAQKVRQEEHDVDHMTKK